MADSEEKKLIQDPNSTSDKKPAKEKPTAVKTGKRGIAFLSIFLVLMVAAASAAGGYYLWQQQLRLSNAQQLDANRLHEQLLSLETQANTLNQSIQTNSSLIKTLEEQQKQGIELSQRAIDITNRSQREWMLAEIDYLLRIADRRLQIARDINGAIAALKSADERIHDLGDLNMLAIRKQLAKDIGLLKATHQADVNGTALALDQIIMHLAEMPFKSVQEEVKIQLEDKPATDAADNQQTGFVDSVLNTVMSIGDIKIHERSIQPASSAQQHIQIEQLLRNHLLGARLAVLRFDQQQFSYDIEQAIKIIHSHYKTTDNRVAQMSNDLSQFGTVNLIPALPNITTSWNMLQQLIKGKPAETKPATPNKDVSNTSINTSAAEVL
jgi:uroporphyrin-3 C-methyltransferase